MVAGKLFVSLIRPGEGTLNILLLGKGKGNDWPLPCADRCAEARVTSGKETNTAIRRRWSQRENGLTVLPQTTPWIQEPSDHVSYRRHSTAEEFPARIAGLRNGHPEVAAKN